MFTSPFRYGVNNQRHSRFAAKFMSAAMPMVSKTGVSGCSIREPITNATVMAAPKISNPLNIATLAFAARLAQKGYRINYKDNNQNTTLFGIQYTYINMALATTITHSFRFHVWDVIYYPTKICARPLLDESGH